MGLPFLLMAYGNIITRFFRLRDSADIPMEVQFLEYITNEICTLLVRKRELAQRWAQNTEAMFFAPSEQLEGHIAQRDEMLRALSALDERMAALCADRDDVKAALDSARDGRDLPPELRAVHACALEAQASANAAMRGEWAVRQRLEGEQKGLSEKIMAAQTTGEVARQYHRSARMASGVMRPAEEHKTI